MAKMIERRLLGYRLHLLIRLRDKKQFWDSYLPIRLAAIAERRDRRIAAIGLRTEAGLRSAAVAAGIDTPVAALERDARLKRLDERFAWKAKALVQSRRRALAKHPDDAGVAASFDRKDADLASRKETRRAAILLGNRPEGAGSAAAKEAYETRLKVAQDVSRIESERLAADAERVLARIHAEHQKKTSAIGARIARLEAGVASLKDASAAAELLPEGVHLRLKNLSMRFGGLLAVDNLSFDVRQGEIFGLIGPNGAGKTTIFNCITRFYRPTSGTMWYRRNAVETIRLNDFPVHDIVRQGIVRTFQNVELVWELSILDNLLVGAHTVYRCGFFHQLFHTRKLRREEEVMRARAMGVLATLGLAPYAFAYPYGLPYGILKKVEVARTLMAAPKLIILDEPAAGLNDKETEELAVLIRKIRDDYHATIFLVEHDMGLVMDVCDTVCAISFGKMLAIGTPAQIQANALVRQAYLGEES